MTSKGQHGNVFSYCCKNINRKYICYSKTFKKRGKKAMFTPEDRRDMFLKACFLF